MLNHSLVPVGSTGYDIDNSLRFNDDDSAYLSRTPSTAGNRKTWTWSGWVKLGSAGFVNNQSLFGSGDYDNYIYLNDGTNPVLRLNSSTGSSIDVATSLYFRDPSAWYHIMVVLDTTQGTTANRVKMYVNGEQVTNFNYATYPSQNAEPYINNTGSHAIGRRHHTGGPLYFDGYLSEVNFVDGQALTPADFGETDETYGHWKPKKYTGTYGTNGFYLDFKNSGSLGNDVSGAGNNWTPNNLAATDQMLDSPTNNFCTLSPLDSGTTLSEGNLKTTTSGWQDGTATIGMTSGKWYVEYVKLDSTSSLIGVTKTEISGLGGFTDAWRFIYSSNDGKVTNTGMTPTVDYTAGTYTTGDIVGCAVDSDTGEITFFKNGTQVYNDTIAALATEDLKFYTRGSTFNAVINFGQDSSFAGNKTAQGNADDNGYGDFYYAPPTGFLALCTQNLPEPTVVPSEHFNTVLYTGDNTNDRSITGVGFQPDLVWIKPRSIAGSHGLFDAVRGADRSLRSHDTRAEDTSPANKDLDSFNADGFTVDQSNFIDTNTLNATTVAWNWKANGAGVSNTNGTITSTVSANADAGFSIVTYNANGSGDFTFGHGLNTTPELVFCKRRDSSGDWMTHHKDLGYQGHIFLNSTAGSFNHGYSYLVPGSTTVHSTGTSSTKYDSVAYCFHSVEGYSKVGSYTGNGSTDGTFVHCGFRPAYVMIKRTDSTSDWQIIDTTRSLYNIHNAELQANQSYSEWAGTDKYDIVSNGFKHRNGYASHNASGGTYIYYAIAETDFKHSNAR